MKTSNRLLERIGIEQAEVVYCPQSRDIEVWYQEKYALKVYINARNGKSHVARSAFVDQTVAEDDEWSKLVDKCNGLAPEDAFQTVLQYAQSIAGRLESAGAIRKAESCTAAG